MKQKIYIVWAATDADGPEGLIDRIYVQEAKAKARVRIITRPNLDNDPDLQYYYTEEEVIL
jgi:hypothetical protein